MVLSKRWLSIVLSTLILVTAIGLVLFHTAPKPPEEAVFLVQPEPTTNSSSSLELDGFLGLEDTNCTCSEYENPVCDTQFMTHRNRCQALCVQAQVQYAGACQFYTASAAPQHCQSCELSCPDGEAIYADVEGCPICQCQIQNPQWGP